MNFEIEHQSVLRRFILLEWRILLILLIRSIPSLLIIIGCILWLI